MLVTCKKNSASGLPKQFREFAFGQDDQGLLPLTVGKQYVVSARQRVKGTTFFLLDGFEEIVKDPRGDFYNALEDGEEAAVNAFLAHYEKYAKQHDLWYVDGKPGRESQKWPK